MPDNSHEIISLPFCSLRMSRKARNVCVREFDGTFARRNVLWWSKYETTINCSEIIVQRRRYVIIRQGLSSMCTSIACSRFNVTLNLGLRWRSLTNCVWFATALGGNTQIKQREELKGAREYDADIPDERRDWINLWINIRNLDRSSCRSWRSRQVSVEQLQVGTEQCSRMSDVPERTISFVNESMAPWKSPSLFVVPCCWHVSLVDTGGNWG